MLLLALALNAVFPQTSHASAELDRRYALDTVGYLKSWDNADGLFTDYVADAYRRYFARQSRFTVQDLSKANTVMSQSKIPYKKQIEDPGILVQVARASRSQTLIRTEVTQEGPQYQFKIDWLLAPSMETISTHTLTMIDPRDGNGFSMQDLRSKLEKTLDQVIHDVPFAGSVNGRDRGSVTLNLGSNTGLLPGDTVQVGTLDAVKRHPLLNRIVEWQITPTGQIMIDQVDERLSFGHVISEEPGQQIMAQQKVTAILKKPAAPTLADSRSIPGTPGAKPSPALADTPPTYGWVAGNLNLGGFSRDYSALDNSIGESGGGFLFGAAVQGQLWFTRNWFADLKVGYGIYSYSQHQTTPGASGDSTSVGSSGWTQVTLDGGYAFLLTDDVMGPKGWVKLGYRINSYSLPDSSANETAAISFKSLFVGVGGDVPIRAGWGAIADLGVGLFKSADEDSNFSGATTSVSDISLMVGGYYRFTQRITFRATLDMQYDDADFTSPSGSTQITLSQKVITFSPALIYYF
jgi:hypothetical protein